jgi:hypothetical protein
MDKVGGGATGVSLGDGKCARWIWSAWPLRRRLVRPAECAPGHPQNLLSSSTSGYHGGEV